MNAKLVWTASMACAGAWALHGGVTMFDLGSGGISLPDGTGLGYANIQTVTTLPTAVQALRVRLNLQPGAGGMVNGDIYATVSYQASAVAPITAYSVLLNRPGRDAGAGNEDGYYDNGMNVSLGATGDDIHTYQLQTVPAVGAGLTGNWAADGRDVDPFDVVTGSSRTSGLGSFQSLNPNGVWTLYVEDTMSGGLAKVMGWGLEWTPVPEPTGYGCFAAGTLLWVGVWRLRRRP
jgi:hypothetical protein